jgi:hypothetical protein
MKKLTRIVALVLLVSFPATAFGWGDTGHMAVAQIAYDNLNATEREQVDELAALIEFNDKQYEFVTAGCWMDDIRNAPMFEPLKDWHFITQRFIVNSAAADEPPPPINAASIIKWLVGRIKSRDESDLKKAYYLAQLTHLVGDIHQPLHTVTRYTPQRPGGDLGGNFFKLSDDAPRPNLHSYWDGGGGAFAFIARPLNDTRRNSLTTLATNLQTRFPRSQMTAEVNQLDPLEWAREGKTLAIDEVYPNITEGSIPSATYEENAQKICRRRVALAGYRLAAILKQAF